LKIQSLTRKANVELPYLFQDFKKHVALVGAPEERFAAVAGTRDKVQLLGAVKAFETRYG